MNKRLFFLFGATLIAGISCKKDDTTTPTPPIVELSYLDVAAGHTWNYENTDNGTSPVNVSTYSVTSSSADTTIGTKSYRKFTRSGVGAPEYKNLTGTDYYEYVALPSVLGGGKVENLYLSSVAAVGTVWSQPLPPISASGLTANVTKTDTIRARGLTMTVKGKVYTDVIQVSSGFTVNSSNLPIVVSTDIQNYYAPKVGRISGKNIVRLQVPLVSMDQKIDTKTELSSVNF